MTRFYTPAEFARMTNQDVFDVVCNHFAQQGRKSMRSDGSMIAAIGLCALRGREDRACAIGIFIPDDVYRPEMEGETDRLVGFKELSYLMDRWKLLQELQLCHDKNDDVTELKARLTRVAHNFELDAGAIGRIKAWGR